MIVQDKIAPIINTEKFPAGNKQITEENSNIEDVGKFGVFYDYPVVPSARVVKQEPSYKIDKINNKPKNVNRKRIYRWMETNEKICWGSKSIF